MTTKLEGDLKREVMIAGHAYTVAGKDWSSTGSTS
jgi:hypothetical protein